MNAINPKQVGKNINELFKYLTIAKVNDHNFTLIRAKDRTLDFHVHNDSDEAFFVLEGQMRLESRDEIVEIKTGEMCVVPKGVEHRPICTSEVLCMLIEKEDTLTPQNTGGTYKKQTGEGKEIGALEKKELPRKLRPTPNKTSFPSP